MIRRSLEAVLTVWFKAERRRAGDMFATEAELEGILSDPLGHADLLKGRDAYTFVLAVLNEETADMSQAIAEETAAPCPQCGMRASHSHHTGSVHGPAKGDQ